MRDLARLPAQGAEHRTVTGRFRVARNRCLAQERGEQIGAVAPGAKREIACVSEFPFRVGCRG
jgi:hypothetical protein